MTAVADTPAAVPGGSSKATDHLWMHFSRMGSFATEPVPIVERGEGAYIYDSTGRRYLDALSGLFVVQAGYGRDEIADAAALRRRYLDTASLARLPLAEGECICVAEAD